MAKAFQDKTPAEWKQQAQVLLALGGIDLVVCVSSLASGRPMSSYQIGTTAIGLIAGIVLCFYALRYWRRSRTPE